MEVTSKASLLLLTICVLTLGLSMPRANAQVPLIMDQDISSDHDDVGDLAVANALADMGECNIIACVANSTNGASALVQNTICTYYGRPNVPCGRRADVGGVGGYPATISNEYPHPLYANYLSCPIDVNVYRHALASQADHSVVIVTTGYLNNLQNLMQSGPDADSPLNGIDLIKQKVALLSCAGGWFPNGDEFNFRVEPTAANYVVTNWPLTVPVMFHNFPDGSAIFSAGRLASTDANPVRRAWELTSAAPPAPWDYPTWGQMAVIYGVRTAERTTLNSAVTVGHANVDSVGHSTWLTDINPGTQGYTLELERFVKQQENDALLMDCGAPVSKGTIHPPNQPSNLRATPVGSTQVNLQWTDNSWNETGFTIETRTNGVWSTVATVGPNVTTYSNTGLTSNVNKIYRIVATNALGRSDYNATDASQNPVVEVFPNGWTETNLNNPSDHTPIYSYYQNNLNWAINRPGTQHVVVNNDSNTGQDLTINLQVASDGGYGDFYVYFLYQDQNNWYRFHSGNNGEGTVSRFEKSIGGTITQIGASGEAVAVGQGVEGQTWQILVSHTGNLQWWTNSNPNTVNHNATLHQALNVSDPLSFTSGKLALGTNYGTPFWGNFNYDASSGGGGSSPAAPTGLGATAGNAQVSLSWTAGSGATSYNVYRGTTAGGESTTAVKTGLTTTTYTDTGLTNGTAYYYKVAGVNTVSTSGYSNEANATPTAGTGGGGSGTSIGIQFVGSGTALTATASAGLPAVAQMHWTTVTGSSFSSVALSDSTGANTSATLTGGADGGYRGGGAFTGGDATLVSGEVFDGDINNETHLVTIASIPYAAYDLYIYGGCDAPGRNATFTITPSGGAASSKSFLTTNSATSWIEGTNTWNGSGTVPTLAAGNYVHFTGLTATSFTLKFGGVGNIGMNGIQIVRTGPVITSSTTVTSAMGSVFNYQITATPTPTSYNATGLPTGLSVNTGTGVISGTPTVFGTFPIMISATSSTGTTTVTLTLTLNPASPSGSTDTPTLPPWGLPVLTVLLVVAAGSQLPSVRRI